MLSRRIWQLPLILLVVAICAALTGIADAAIIIKTNAGGADAEVREETQTVDLDGNVDPNVGNRGNNTELATRLNRVGGTQNSSVSYMKFDISSLPAATDPWWVGKNVWLQINIRHENLARNSRLESLNPGGNPNYWWSDWTRMEFAVRGLEPGNVYGGDTGGSYTKTDRSGNNFTSPFYEYDWDEGTGANGTGITYYSAPGITPHCMVQGLCDTTEYAGDPNTTVSNTNTLQSKGVIDDFNADTRLLGAWNWPEVNPQNHLPVGLPVSFYDVDLKQLVLDAKTAGRDTVTLIVSHNLDPYQENVTINTSMFAFNYIMTPKDQNPMRTDTNYDSDVYDPLNPLGSPWSGASNANGRFSPKLIIWVPEPSTMLLVGLGVVGLAMIRRRK